MTQVCVNLGELITEMGWLSPADVEDALAFAYETGQPLGQVLILLEKLTRKEVQALVVAQSLLRDGLISKTQARSALTISSLCGFSLEDSLLVFFGRYFNDKSDYANRLGELLVASGCVGEITVQQARDYCRRVGLQLGRALTMRRQIAKSVLEAALEAQTLLRANAIAPEHAIEALETIKLGAGAPMIVEIQEMPLGSLLVHAGILEPQQLSELLEVAALNGKALGEVLVIFSLMSEPLLIKALELQKLLRMGRIRIRRAIKALHIAHQSNLSVSAALASITDAPGTGVDMSVALFLKRSGLFQQYVNELDSIDQSSLENREQVQFLSGFVTNEQLIPAVRCTFLVRYSLISIEQALVAYHCCRLSGQDLDAFLHEVGWVEPEALALVANQRAAQHLGAVAA
jgi:hypothetical protein